MVREIELRRHTDADGDVLTVDGVEAALEIGARLRGDYRVAVSTGAQRATQTLACFLAALGASECRAVSSSSLVCGRRWRAAGARPTRRREAAHSRRYARLTRISSQRIRSDSAPRSFASSTPCPTAAALVVGHSPTNEAAILGLTGEIVAPLEKGAGVLVVARDDRYRVRAVE